MFFSFLVPVVFIVLGTLAVRNSWIAIATWRKFRQEGIQAQGTVTGIEGSLLGSRLLTITFTTAEGQEIEGIARNMKWGRYLFLSLGDRVDVYYKPSGDFVADLVLNRIVVYISLFVGSCIGLIGVLSLFQI